MLYEMNNPKDKISIKQYGKAYGVVLMKKWLPNASKIKNLFVLDSYDEFKKIEDRLPEKFSVRADSKIGEPHLKIQGNVIEKGMMQDYIGKVKKCSEKGVVICMDAEPGTQDNVHTNGAFNVYFEVMDKVFIDYLGKGFDIGGITRGKENHEVWVIDWENLLFATPYNMNKYRTYIVNDSDYIESAYRRLGALLNKGFTRDDIKGIIPRAYKPMSLAMKEKILDEIIFPIYCESKRLKDSGLTSFGVQGMIIGDNLCPIEFNRRERFASKDFFEDIKDNER